jgi:hypothetical protein
MAEQKHMTTKEAHKRFIRRLERSLKTGHNISGRKPFSLEPSRIDLPNPRRSAWARVDTRYLLYITVFSFASLRSCSVICSSYSVRCASEPRSERSGTTASEEAQTARQRPQAPIHPSFIASMIVRLRPLNGLNLRRKTTASKSRTFHIHSLSFHTIPPDSFPSFQTSASDDQH